MSRSNEPKGKQASIHQRKFKSPLRWAFMRFITRDQQPLPMENRDRFSNGGSICAYKLVRFPRLIWRVFGRCYTTSHIYLQDHRQCRWLDTVSNSSLLNIPRIRHQFYAPNIPSSTYFLIIFYFPSYFFFF